MNIYQSIEMLSKEKGIDPQIVLDAVKDAMLVAAKKHYRTEGEVVAELDETSGALQIFALKKVVPQVQDPDNEITLNEAIHYDPLAAVDSVVRIPLNTDVLGRISAQTAKQVILQKVREAERETVYTEFADRVGELVNCSVKRVEGPDLVVDIGKTEVRLPKKEQSRAESFSVGDRVRCVIKSVEKAGKNAGVTVSRAAPELVMRLFEQEVPEIYDGTVVIKGCAREAGERTKIAVSSRDRDVDSVGACVGMKGSRVQSIIRELRGEKIDIIQFSEDPVVFATNALSPAKISRVAIIDSAQRHMEVIVDDSQLSLAIGKKGQNVRLAAKLLGWHIDIKSEEEKRQEVESEMASLVVPGAPISVLRDHGLAEELVTALAESHVSTVEQLGAMTPEQLAAIQGIDPEMIEAIQSAVLDYYEQFEVEVGEEDQSTEGESEGEPLKEGAEAPEIAEAEVPAADTVAGDEPAESVEETPEETSETKPGQPPPAEDESSEETEPPTPEEVAGGEALAKDGGGSEMPEESEEAAGTETDVDADESDTIKRRNETS